MDERYRRFGDASDALVVAVGRVPQSIVVARMQHDNWPLLPGVLFVNHSDEWPCEIQLYLCLWSDLERQINTPPVDHEDLVHSLHAVPEERVERAGRRA